MEKRTYFEDVASLALLYNHRASSRMMLSYEKIKEFDTVINENLDEMNSELYCISPMDDSRLIYFYSADEEGKEYLILRPDINFDEEIKRYNMLPYELILASQMENALDVIGLELDKGNIVKRNSTEEKKKQEVLGKQKVLKLLNNVEKH